MPPKKPSGKKGKGKKKKGPDENAAFNEFLNEMFFLSKVEKQAITERRKLKIREIFSLFQERGRAEVMDVRELGMVVRELGLNPSQSQLAIIQSLVEDPENPNFVPYARLEKCLLEILETKELRSQELVEAENGGGGGAAASASGGSGGGKGAAAASGPTVVTRTQLLYTEPEAAVQEAFDVLWDALGRKIDHDKQRYLDAEALRELLMGGAQHGFSNNNNNVQINSAGGNTLLEAFSEDDLQHFLAAAQDVGTTTINEELFMALMME